MSDPGNPSEPQQYYIRVRGRILGPFSVEKLQSLRSRGQFSRVHEVSIDRRKWSPASSIDHLVVPAEAAPSSRHVFSPDEGGAVSAAGQMSPTAGSTAASPPASSRPTPPGQSIGGGPVDNPLWYYRVNDHQFGPTTTTELRTLVSSGHVDRREFVWKDGMLAWLAIQDVAELSGGATSPHVVPSGSIADRIRRQRHASRIALVGLLFAASAVVATIYFSLPKKLGVQIPTASDLKSMIDSGALTSIEGVDAERRLGQCVGLIVTGVRSTLQDGTVVEVPYGTGTCFVIDKDGHALTNKHVVEEVQKLFRADLWREKIKKELLVKVEPKIWVFFDAKQYAATIVTTSAEFDLAILKIDRSFKNYLRLSSQDNIARGERVAAFGFPGIDRQPLSEDELFERIKKERQKNEFVRSVFKDRDFIFSRTDGTTSKVSKEQEGRVWVQHTARINPGNSGGPLLTADGVVCGMNTLGLTGDQGRPEAPLFYSLSIGQMKEELDEQVKGAEWR